MPYVQGLWAPGLGVLKNFRLRGAVWVSLIGVDWRTGNFVKGIAITEVSSALQGVER